MGPMTSRNDPCWCGSGIKWKKCHYPDKKGSRGNNVESYLKQWGIVLKNQEQIKGIRHACKLAATIVKKTCDQAKEGVTTNQLDAFAHKLHIEAGATPAPLGYGSPPYPKSICTSLNHEICHGIPNDIPLKGGDFLNIDVSCIINGYFGDCSAMVAIGDISEEKLHIMGVARECLYRSIAILKPGLMLFKIGDAISEYAEKEGCSVVDQFVGHGVGIEFHEAPQVPHHRNGINIPLAPGMIFTIEPMINGGVKEGVIDKDHHWTAYTRDGKPSAQWEHTLLITEEGHEILTLT